MIEMSVYLREEKIKWLHKMRDDLLKDCGVEVPHGSGFSKKSFVHFMVVDDKKYVHKEALKFIYTNGGTYFMNTEMPKYFVVNQNAVEKKRIDGNVERMFNFFREGINQCKIYPEFLAETENFFVFKYYSEDEWERLERLTRYDTDFIKKSFDQTFKDEKEVITPFYNQMYNKLFRHKKTGEIVMVDLKGLEVWPKTSLAILMYGEYVNDLYLLERRFLTRAYILKPFAIDYPVQETNIIRHY